MKYLLISILTFFSLTTQAQSLQEKKENVLNLLKEARMTTVDSIAEDNYYEIGKARRLFPYDSAKLMIEEGIRYCESKKEMSKSHFLLKLYLLKLDYKSREKTESIAKLQDLLPLTKDLAFTTELYVLKDIGLLYRSQKMYDSALYYLDLSKQIAIQNDDSLNLGKNMAHIAGCYYSLGDKQKAQETLESILANNTKARSLTNVLTLLTHIYNYTNHEYEKTVELFERETKGLDKWELVSSASDLLNNYVTALMKTGRLSKAMRIMDQYIGFYKMNGNTKGSMRMHKHYGRGLIELNRPAESIPYLDEALGYAKEIDAKSYSTDIYYQKVRAYIQLGMQDSAFANLDTYRELINDIASDNQEAKYAESLAEYETKEKQQEIELLQKENEIERAKSWRFRYLLVIGLILVLASIIGLRNYLKRKEEKSKKAVVEAELTSIRSQMNPHFMFNALNSVKSYIIINEPEAAAKYLSKFASLMRGILDLSSKPFITLQEELDSLDLYVEMEEMRFKDQFKYTIQAAKNIDTHRILVPPLFLQPFVENAIKHGLLPLRNRTGELVIEIGETDGIVHFKIRDNGVGRKLDSPKHNYQSKGMSLSKDRIAVLNNKLPQNKHVIINDLKDVDGNAQGTEIVIHLQKKTNL